MGDGLTWVGVRGRNSNNERIRELLDWSLTLPLRAGMTATYSWIRSEIESGQVSR